MDKTKKILTQTLVLIVNSALVVGGVFYLKNQQDQKNQNTEQDSNVDPNSITSLSAAANAENDGNNAQNIETEAPIQRADIQEQQLSPVQQNTTTPKLSATVKKSSTTNAVNAPVPAPTPMPKKTSKKS